ncbi:hypothetical protein [Kitasatospora sp. NPDC002522]
MKHWGHLGADHAHLGGVLAQALGKLADGGPLSRMAREFPDLFTASAGKEGVGGFARLFGHFTAEHPLHGNALFQLGHALGEILQEGGQNVASDLGYQLFWTDEHAFTASWGSFVSGMAMGAMGHVLHKTFEPLFDRYQNWLRERQWRENPDGAKYFGLLHPLNFVSFLANMTGNPAPFPVPRPGGHDGDESWGQSAKDLAKWFFSNPFSGFDLRSDTPIVNLFTHKTGTGDAAREENPGKDGFDAALGGGGVRTAGGDGPTIGGGSTSRPVTESAPFLPLDVGTPGSGERSFSAMVTEELTKIGQSVPVEGGAASDHSAVADGLGVRPTVSGVLIADPRPGSEQANARAESALNHLPRRDDAFTVAMHVGEAGAPIGPEQLADVLVKAYDGGKLDGKSWIDFLSCRLGAVTERHVPEAMRALWAHQAANPRAAAGKLTGRAPVGDVWVVPKLANGRPVEAAEYEVIVADHVGIDQAGRPVVVQGPESFWRTFTDSGNPDHTPKTDAEYGGLLAPDGAVENLAPTGYDMIVTITPETTALAGSVAGATKFGPGDGPGAPRMIGGVGRFGRDVVSLPGSDEVVESQALPPGADGAPSGRAYLSDGGFLGTELEGFRGDLPDYRHVIVDSAGRGQVSEELDAYPAPWGGGPKPYFVMAELSGRQVAAVGVQGEAVHLGVEQFAAVVAADEDLQGLHPDAPIVLAVPFGGGSDLELPRAVAVATGRTVFAVTGDLVRTEVAGGGWSFGLRAPGPDADGTLHPRGQLVRVEPPARGGVDPALGAPGHVVTVLGEVLADHEVLTRPIVSFETHGTIGRGAHSEGDWAVRDAGYSRLTTNTEYQDWPPMAVTFVHDVPWDPKHAYFFGAQADSEGFDLPTATGTGKVSGAELGGYLARRPSIGALRQAATDGDPVSIVLVACHSADLAQAVADKAGLTVHAPVGTGGLWRQHAPDHPDDTHDLVVERDRSGASGEFLTFQPGGDTPVDRADNPRMSPYGAIFDIGETALSDAAIESVRAAGRGLAAELLRRFDRGHALPVVKAVGLAGETVATVRAGLARAKAVARVLEEVLSAEFAAHQLALDAGALVRAESVRQRELLQDAFAGLDPELRRRVVTVELEYPVPLFSAGAGRGGRDLHAIPGGGRQQAESRALTRRPGAAPDGRAFLSPSGFAAFEPRDVADQLEGFRADLTDYQHLMVDPTLRADDPNHVVQNLGRIAAPWADGPKPYFVMVDQPGRTIELTTDSGTTVHLDALGFAAMVAADEALKTRDRDVPIVLAMPFGGGWDLELVRAVAAATGRTVFAPTGDIVPVEAPGGGWSFGLQAPFRLPDGGLGPRGQFLRVDPPSRGGIDRSPSAPGHVTTIGGLVIGDEQVLLRPIVDSEKLTVIGQAVASEGDWYHWEVPLGGLTHALDYQLTLESDGRPTPLVREVQWDPDHAYFFVSHSSPAEFELRTEHGSLSVDGAELGGLLRRRPSLQALRLAADKGKPASIVLLACDSAPLAQAVANAVGLTVHAPTEMVGMSRITDAYDRSQPAYLKVVGRADGAAGLYRTFRPGGSAPSEYGEPRMVPQTVAFGRDTAVLDPRAHAHVVLLARALSAEIARRHREALPMPVIRVTGRAGDPDTAVGLGGDRAQAVGQVLWSELRDELERRGAPTDPGELIRLFSAGHIDPPPAGDFVGADADGRQESATIEVEFPPTVREVPSGVWVGDPLLPMASELRLREALEQFPVRPEAFVVAMHVGERGAPLTPDQLARLLIGAYDAGSLDGKTSVDFLSCRLGAYDGDHVPRAMAALWAHQEAHPRAGVPVGIAGRAPVGDVWLVPKAGGGREAIVAERVGVRPDGKPVVVLSESSTWRAFTDSGDATHTATTTLQGWHLTADGVIDHGLPEGFDGQLADGVQGGDADGLSPLDGAVKFGGDAGLGVIDGAHPFVAGGVSVGRVQSVEERVGELAVALAAVHGEGGVHWLADPDLSVAERGVTGAAIGRFPRDDRFFTVATHVVRERGRPTWRGVDIAPAELASALVRLLDGGVWSGALPLQFAACDLGAGLAGSYTALVLREVRVLRPDLPLVAYAPRGTVWFVPRATGPFAVESAGVGHTVAALAVGWDGDGRARVVADHWVELSVAVGEDAVRVRELGAHLPVDGSVPPTSVAAPEGYLPLEQAGPDPVVGQVPLGAVEFGDDAVVPVLYAEQAYRDHAAEFEQHIGALAFEDPEARAAAADAVKSLSQLLRVADVELPPDTTAALFFRDDPTEAGQIGSDPDTSPFLTLRNLTQRGNVRELMTALHNAVTSDSPYGLARLVDELIRTEDWERAGDLGFDVDELRRRAAFGKGELHRELAETLGTVAKDSVAVFQADLLRGVGMLSPEDPFWQAHVAEYVQSVLARRARPAAGPDGPSGRRRVSDFAAAGAELSDREQAYLAGRGHGGSDPEVPWVPRSERFLLDAASVWAKEMGARGIPTGSGISAAAARTMGAYRLLGGTRPEQFARSLYGWLLPTKEHSLYEIVAGARLGGGPESVRSGYHGDAAELYRSIPGLGLPELRGLQSVPGLQVLPHEQTYLDLIAAAPENGGFRESDADLRNHVKERQDDFARAVSSPGSATQAVRAWLDEHGVTAAEIVTRLNAAHFTALAVYSGPAHRLLNPLLKYRGLAARVALKAEIAAVVDDHFRRGTALPNSVLGAPGVDEIMQRPVVDLATPEALARAKEVVKLVNAILPSIEQEMARHSQLLQDALRLLPPAVGTVYRGNRALGADPLGMLGKVLSEHGGDSHVFPQFASFSANESVATTFALSHQKSLVSHPVLWEVRATGRLGVKIAPFSRLPDEAEVLFRPGLRVRITDRQRLAANDGATRIYAEEEHGLPLLFAGDRALTRHAELKVMLQQLGGTGPIQHPHDLRPLAALIGLPRERATAAEAGDWRAPLDGPSPAGTRTWHLASVTIALYGPKGLTLDHLTLVRRLADVARGHLRLSPDTEITRWHLDAMIRSLSGIDPAIQISNYHRNTLLAAADRLAREDAPFTMDGLRAALKSAVPGTRPRVAPIPGAQPFGPAPVLEAYAHPDYATEASAFETQLGGYLHNHPQAIEAARNSVARLWDLLQAAHPDKSAGEIAETFVHDDPHSAGQIGGEQPLDGFLTLLDRGNSRELMTAFFNAAYFKDSPLSLKSLLNQLVETRDWARAAELGLDVEELKVQAAYLNGTARTRIGGFLGMLMPGREMFNKDVFASGNLLFRSKNWMELGADFAASISARKSVPSGEEDTGQAALTPRDLRTAGASLSTRELRFLTEHPVALQLLGMREEAVPDDRLPRSEDGSVDLDALRGRRGVITAWEDGDSGMVRQLVRDTVVNPRPRDGDPGEDEAGAELPLSWRTGRMLNVINPQSSWYRDIHDRRGMPVIAGVSRTAARMLNAFRLMRVTGSEPDHLVLSLLSWMLTPGDHSVYEILKGAELSGLIPALPAAAYQDAATMYRHLPGISEQELRTHVARDGVLPHERHLPSAGPARADGPSTAARPGHDGDQGAHRPEDAGPSGSPPADTAAPRPAPRRRPTADGPPRRRPTAEAPPGPRRRPTAEGAAAVSGDGRRPETAAQAPRRILSVTLGERGRVREELAAVAKADGHVGADASQDAALDALATRVPALAGMPAEERHARLTAAGYVLRTLGKPLRADHLPAGLALADLAAARRGRVGDTLDRLTREVLGLPENAAVGRVEREVLVGPARLLIAVDRPVTVQYLRAVEALRLLGRRELGSTGPLGRPAFDRVARLRLGLPEGTPLTTEHRHDVLDAAVADVGRSGSLPRLTAPVRPTGVRWVGDPHPDPVARELTERALRRLPESDRYFTVAMHTGAGGLPVERGVVLPAGELAARLLAARQAGAWDGRKPLRLVACELAADPSYVRELMGELWRNGVTAEAVAADGPVWFTPTGDGGAELVAARSVGFAETGGGGVRPVLEAGHDWIRYSRPDDPDAPPVTRTLGPVLRSDGPARTEPGTPVRPIDGAVAFHRGSEDAAMGLGAIDGAHPFVAGGVSVGRVLSGEERVGELVVALAAVHGEGGVHWLADPELSGVERAVTGAAVGRFVRDERFFTVATHVVRESGRPSWRGVEVAPGELASALVRLLDGGVWDGRPLQFVACDLGAGLGGSYAAQVLEEVRVRRSGVALVAYAPRGTVWFVPRVTGPFAVESSGVGHTVAALAVGWDGGGRARVVADHWVELSVAVGEDAVRVRELGAHLPVDGSVPPTSVSAPEGYLPLGEGGGSDPVVGQVPLGAVEFGDDAVVPVLYAEQAYRDHAAEFEQRIGALAFDDPEARTAAAETVAALSRLLRVAGEDVPPDTIAALFVRDNPTEAGQIGFNPFASTLDTLNRLIERGNVRELMTALHNAVTSNAPYGLARLVERLVRTEDWERAGDLGFDVDELRRRAAFGKGELHRELAETLGTVAKDSVAVFQADLLRGVGMLSPEDVFWQAHVAEYVQSVLAHRARPAAGPDGPSGRRRLSGFADAGAELSEREQAYLAGRGHGGSDPVVPWVSRSERFLLDTASVWAKEMGARGIPTASGISAAAARTMGAYRLLRGTRPEQFARSLYGWLLPTKEHSLYEIVAGARLGGGPESVRSGYHGDAAELYRSIPGLGLPELRGLRSVPGLQVLPHEQTYLDRIAVRPENGGFRENNDDVREHVDDLQDDLAAAVQNPRDASPILRNWLDEHGVTAAEILTRLNAAHLTALAVYSGPAYRLLNPLLKYRGLAARVALKAEVAAVVDDHFRLDKDLPESIRTARGVAEILRRPPVDAADPEALARAKEVVKLVNAILPSIEQEMAQHSQLLLDALRLLPPAVGTVYRGNRARGADPLGVFRRVLSQQGGDSYVFRQFASFSEREAVASGFAEGHRKSLVSHPVLWEVQATGRLGVKIAPFSRVPHEAEVLFRPGMRVRITDRQRLAANADVTRIHAEEESGLPLLFAGDPKTALERDARLKELLRQLGGTGPIQHPHDLRRLAALIGLPRDRATAAEAADWRAPQDGPSAAGTRTWYLGGLTSALYGLDGLTLDHLTLVGKLSDVARRHLRLSRDTEITLSHLDTMIRSLSGIHPTVEISARHRRTLLAAADRLAREDAPFTTDGLRTALDAATPRIRPHSAPILGRQTDHPAGVRWVGDPHPDPVARELTERALRRLPESDRYFTVAMHTGAGGLPVERGVVLPAGELAARLLAARQAGAWDGRKPLRLVACELAADPSYVRGLMGELWRNGVTAEAVAADGPVWFTPIGGGGAELVAARSVGFAETGGGGVRPVLEAGHDWIRYSRPDEPGGPPVMRRLGPVLRSDGPARTEPGTPVRPIDGAVALRRGSSRGASTTTQAQPKSRNLSDRPRVDAQPGRGRGRAATARETRPAAQPAARPEPQVKPTRLSVRARTTIEMTAPGWLFATGRPSTGRQSEEVRASIDLAQRLGLPLDGEHVEPSVRTAYALFDAAKVGGRLDVSGAALDRMARTVLGLDRRDQVSAYRLRELASYAEAVEAAGLPVTAARLRDVRGLAEVAGGVQLPRLRALVEEIAGRDQPDATVADLIEVAGVIRDGRRLTRQVLSDAFHGTGDYTVAREVLVGALRKVRGVEKRSEEWIVQQLGRIVYELPARRPLTAAETSGLEQLAVTVRDLGLAVDPASLVKIRQIFDGDWDAYYTDDFSLARFDAIARRIFDLPAGVAVTAERRARVLEHAGLVADYGVSPTVVHLAALRELLDAAPGPGGARARLAAFADAVFEPLSAGPVRSERIGRLIELATVVRQEGPLTTAALQVAEEVRSRPARLSLPVLDWDASLQLAAEDEAHGLSEQFVRDFHRDQSGGSQDLAIHRVATGQAEYVRLPLEVLADLGVLGISPMYTERVLGIPLVNQRKFQQTADEQGIVIEVRPTNPDSVPHLKAGALPKPVDIKAKTISEEDIWLGAKPEDKGLVGFFLPELPERTAELDAEPGRYDRVMARHRQRTVEHGELSAKMAKLEKEKRFRVRDGVVQGRDADGAWRPIAGDHDILDLHDVEGHRVDDATYRESVETMIHRDMGVMHGAHMFWQPETEFDKMIFEKIVNSHRPGGEPLVRFVPGMTRPILSTTEPELPSSDGRADLGPFAGDPRRHSEAAGTDPRVGLIDLADEDRLDEDDSVRPGGGTILEPWRELSDEPTELTDEEEPAQPARVWRRR